MKTLVIVESPAKAGTISNILGKGYDVTSSFGHVRDLAKDGDGNTGVEVKNKYKPHYIVPKDKKKVVDDLRKKVKKYDKIVLATDEDREGEAIAWHLKEELKLPARKTERITFTEITPDAIKKAIGNPRKVDGNLVDAQQTRRILDRLVGFELTALLWKKVRGKLSAGRVQSVAVRLVVEKEREIKKFKPDDYYKVTAEFKGGNRNFNAELSDKISTKQSAKEFLHKCIKAHFIVKAVEKKPSKRKPSAPFTTSTLQQIAGQKLGFSVSRTMSAAQRLYEAGHITYMRTDSISLSKSALASIAKYVTKEYGEKYSQVRNYKTKAKLSQEAHEAIRPTYIKKSSVSSNKDQQKLYALIRARTLASQMADAEVEKTHITIDISTSNRHFISKGEIVVFDGFLKAYAGTKYFAKDDILLPDLENGQKLTLKHMQALERKTKPPARYSEATLVKKLEELGIGRPSTYAPTIAKITSPSRGYIIKESRDGEPVDYTQLILKNGAVHEDTLIEVAGAQKNKLFARDISLLVTDFLIDNFENIMDYSFTAEVEEKLDHIAIGKEKWIKVLDQYYKPFTKTVHKALDKAGRVTGERELGKDPKTGRTLLVRMSRYGPVAQIGQPDELPEGEAPQYANLLPDQELESITRKEALTLFDLPKSIGKLKNEDIIIGRGRFGPYIKYGEHYVSLGRNTNPFTVTLAEAKEKVKQKLEELKPVAYHKEQPITRGKGRFGPYLKWNDTFVSITKKSGIDFDHIKKDEAIKLVKAKIKKDKDKLIHSWDDGKITLQKGRWGPVFRQKGRRGFIAIPKDETGEKIDIKKLTKLSDKEIKQLLKK